MGLKAAAIALLEPHIRGSVLCLSYPDIVIPVEVAREAGFEVTQTTDHGKVHGIKTPIPETTEFLTSLRGIYPVCGHHPIPWR